MKPALIFIASCFLVVTATAQQRKATGVIYGRVVLQNGGAGKRIWLMAEPLDSGDQWPGTRSDDRGEYRFKSLPCGRYAVHAEDEDAGYSSDLDDENSQPPEVEISPEHPNAEFQVVLPPKAGVL